MLQKRALKTPSVQKLETCAACGIRAGRISTDKQAAAVDVPMITPRKVSAEAMAERLQKVLARNVRAAREALNMTQRDLAAAVKTSQKRIVMIETATANPTILTLARVARCLDKSVVELLTPPQKKPAP